LIEEEIAKEIINFGYDIDSFVKQAIREKITALRRLYKCLENSE